MVGKSKTVSGIATHQAHRRRKDTIMGSMVGADAWSQVREPKGTIGESFEATFHAGLTNNDDARTPGGNFLPATVVRGTSATYVDVNGILQLAGINESRQEYQGGQALGTLMEPPSTNKCQNNNANPDAALSGLVLGGDASATMTRVLDVEALRAAGLHKRCDSGYVVQLDNSSGAGAAYVLVDGETGNTNPHQCIAYWRGSGDGRIQTTGPTGPQAPIPSSYERYVSQQVPNAGTNRLMIQAEAGAILYFILNQLEEQPVASSTIVTSGAATSRDADQLSWPLTDAQGRSILNQSQGMATALWRPGFDDSALLTGQLQAGRVLRFGSGEGVLFGPVKRATNENAFSTFDGTVSITLNLTAPFVKGQEYLIAVRWTGSTREIGYKTLGAWSWLSGGYAGAWPESGILELCPFGSDIDYPSWTRDVYLWDEDRGTAWLEAYFSGIAN